MNQPIDITQVKFCVDGQDGNLPIKFIHSFEKNEYLVADEKGHLYYLQETTDNSAIPSQLQHLMNGNCYSIDAFWALTGVHLPYGKMNYQKSIKVKGCVILFYRLRNFAKAQDLMIATHKHRLIAYQLIPSTKETSHSWSWGENNWEWDVIREFLNSPQQI